MGNTTALCRVLAKYMVFVDTTDIGIAPHLCMNGFWESWITVAMAREIKPGARCIDIGANVGYYTVLMADGVGPEGTVLAVEPVTHLADLVRDTIGVNGFSNTRVVAQPLADSVGKAVTLTVPHKWTGGATIERAPSGLDAAEAHTTSTVDYLTSTWPDVNLVKIDVEGAEQLVWQGMQKTIEKHRDISIIMEINCVRYRDPAGFLARIEACGFPLRFIDFDARIKPVRRDEILQSRAHDDIMLFLHRK